MHFIFKVKQKKTWGGGSWGIEKIEHMIDCFCNVVTSDQLSKKTVVPKMEAQ